MTGARVVWIVAALLAAGVGAEFVWPRLPKPAPVPVSRTASEAAKTTPADPVGVWTAAILARPLFNPDRRPTAVTAAEPTRTQQEPPRLTGILVTPQGSRAIFAAAEGERGTIVGEGMRLGAWQVVAIRSGEVQLSGPDGGRIMRPSYSNAPASSTPVAPDPTALLPPMPETDTRPFRAVAQPSDAARFRNTPPLPAARIAP